MKITIYLQLKNEIDKLKHKVKKTKQIIAHANHPLHSVDFCTNK